VTQQQPNKIHAHPAGRMGAKSMPIRQFHPKQIVRQNFYDDTFNADGVLSAHVKISGSFSVIRTACSNCADGRPSLATTIQASCKMSTAHAPALTMASMAIVIPGRNFGEDLPFSTKFGTCGSSCIERPTPCPTNSRTTEKPLLST